MVSSTKEFDTWWRNYYTEEVFDVHAFTQHLTKAFTFVQDKSKKGISNHIREIQAFQKYFEISYRPNYLSQTIHEAVVTLKEQFSKKIEDLKLPSFIKPEQRYELDFNMHPPKFSWLPSANFSVDFRPLFPYWFICGDFVKILRQESPKRAQWVVPTKHTLNSFKEHLHISIKHVHIESPIYKGVEWKVFRLHFFLIS